MIVQFTKMHGAGNDFIAIDDWRRTVPWQNRGLMATIATRRTGIGCEGILLVQPPDAGENADFRMRFLNPDGGEASMCGNGARCAALFAYRHGLAGQRQRILTASGIVEAEILNPHPASGVVCLRTPSPRPIEIRSVDADGKRWECHCLDTGVPHAVIFVDDVVGIDVRTLGRALRRHPDFAPDGMNIDFVQILSENSLHVRTYERGVEDESGACGTGALASALAAMGAHRLTPPISLLVSSGDTLVVDAVKSADGSWLPSLTGPAREVYRGTLDLAEFSESHS